jgi:hypothetical protein
VSEESSTGTPGTAPPEGEPVPALEAEAPESSEPEAEAEVAAAPPPTPGPAWLRRLRRTSLRVRIAAAVVAAAVIAAVVVVVIPSSSPEPLYASLSEPCGLVGLATLAKYLPDPAAARQSAASSSAYKTGICRWSSTVSGEDRTLVAVITVFGSSSSITSAQQAYAGVLSIIDCHCRGVSVATRAVAGLGDQATTVVVTGNPDADVATVPEDPFPGAYLIVRSSNAEIHLVYGTTSTGTATVRPAGAAQLAGMIAVARGILAGLARHAAVSSHPRVSPEPHYTRQPDPCRMITMATLATYAPGTAVTPGSAATPAPGSPQTSQCGWNSTPVTVSLTLSVFPDALTAQQQYQTDVDTDRQNGTGETVTGAQWLPGLGEQAVAIFQTQSGTSSVLLEVWSGNVEIAYSYTFSTSPDRAALLAGVTAMARDSLAALANPAAFSGREGPVYASPHDACTLIRASTLAAYVPGATAYGSAPTNAAGSELSGCSWFGLAGYVNLFVTIYSDADNAEAGFGLDVQTAEKPWSGIAVVGAQPVTDLGEQATAIFQTVKGGPSVDLFIWSGDAEIEVNLVGVTSGSPGRATMLAGDVAAARDVLAGLPRS